MMPTNRPSFLTFLYPIMQVGLVAPYALPTQNGPLIIEVAYKFGSARYLEVRLGLPEGVREIEPQDIKD